MIPRAVLAVAYARQVMTQTKRDTLVLQAGGFGMELTTPHSKKLIVTEVEQRKKWDGFSDDGESW
jgi:hypothetical protein